MAWTSAAGLILLGVYLSNIRFLDTEWLSRAGCLVVIIGIWSGIGGIFQERILATRLKWRRRNAITNAKARLAEQEADPDKTEKELAAIAEAFDQELTEATHNLRLSVGVLEVSLLVTGTFLWGFGDLFVR